MAKDNKKKLSAEDLEQASGGMFLGYTEGGQKVYTADDPNVAHFASDPVYGGYDPVYGVPDPVYGGNDPVYGM